MNAALRGICSEKAIERKRTEVIFPAVEKCALRTL